MTVPAPARPVNQRRRVNVLRATFLLCLPAILFTRSAWTRPEWVFEVLEVTGIALVIAAVLGRFWAILYIGGHKNRRVVDSGPYSMCRHPLYAASILGVAGFGLMLGSVMLTALLAGLAFAILTLTARREEAFLRATFGTDYARYAARVPRILPDPRLFASDDSVTFSVAHLRHNLRDALLFLLTIPLAEMMEGIKQAGLLPTVPLW